MKNKTRQSKGITLIELMVVMGVCSFITIVIVGTLAIGGRSWVTGEAMIISQQDARIAIEKIASEVREADFVTIGPAAEWIKFSIPIDADQDGFIDLVPGTDLIAYGADDPDDFDTDGDYWELDWIIEYEIVTNDAKDPYDDQIIRKVLLDDGVTVAHQSVIARNINPDYNSTHFVAEDGGFAKTTEGAVIIRITTEVAHIQGQYLNPPMSTTLETRVNLRNG
jgi:type II secretory pathway pseudopilin PulG